MIMQAVRNGDKKLAGKVTPPTPSLADAEPAKIMKKPELFDAIVARNNLKKRDVKPAVEAALSVIAEALRDGSELNLPPLGKLRVVRTRELESGAAVLTLKLRTSGPGAAKAASPLADPETDD